MLTLIAALVFVLALTIGPIVADHLIERAFLAPAHYEDDESADLYDAAHGRF